MIYLDNAATTYPKPGKVVKSISQAMWLYGANPGRSGHKLAMKTSERIYRTRESLASMFDADGPEQVCFTLNCSYALNLALKGISEKGDHILTSDLEHNAVMRPLYHLKEQGVITYDHVETFELSEEQILKNFENSINIHTKAIVCTHMSNVTGFILPIERLGKLCREYQLKFIVDGAQSAGILPISVKRMKIDYLCMPGHKGLYGPMGTGILIVNDRENANTIIEGGTGNLSFSLMQPEEVPERFESGTQNAIGIAALGEGVQFIEKRGMWQISQHEMSLIRALYKGLKETPGVILYTPMPSFPRFGPVLSFNVNGMEAEKVAARLDEKNIAVRAGLHCAPIAHKTLGTLERGTVRVAPGAFNTMEEMDYLLRAIRSVAQKKTVS